MGLVPCWPFIRTTIALHLGDGRPGHSHDVEHKIAAHGVRSKYRFHQRILLSSPFVAFSHVERTHLTMIRGITVVALLALGATSASAAHSEATNIVQEIVSDVVETLEMER